MRRCLRSAAELRHPSYRRSMRWPRDLPPTLWPEPMVDQHGNPMRFTQEGRDAAYAVGNAAFRRIQIRIAWGMFAATAIAIILIGRRHRA